LPLETGATGIGRDDDNVLQIDSLAVAPHHAVIDVEARGMVLKQLDMEYPLLVNGRKVHEHVLKDGDSIVVGKHELYFMDDDPTDRVGGGRRGGANEGAGDAAPATKVVPNVEAAAAAATDKGIPEAGLQMLNGKHIGLVVPLRNPLTRLDRDEACSAVIARRVDGYFLASLSSADIREPAILVNNQPIGDASCKLNDGDIIRINKHRMRFFLTA
jgi:hypothetical protein